MPSVTADGHYYVDLSSDDDFGSYISVYPENLSFDHQVRGVGNIDFQLSYSALDQDGHIVVTPPSPPDYVPFIGPYRSFWRLRYGDIHITAGVITVTNSKLGTDFMTVTGKTWEHFLERWQYPFDPRVDKRVPADPRSAPFYDYQFPNQFQNDELTASGTETPADSVYHGRNRDVIRIFKDIISKVKARPHRIVFDWTSTNSLSGVKSATFAFNIAQMDYMDSVLNDLAETGNGFDWWISWDKKFTWASPYRFGDQGDPATFYTLDNLDDTIGFLAELEFTNNGPRATHITGLGSGLATSRRFGRAFGETTNQAQFSRLDADYDMQPCKNADVLEAKTRKQLSLDINPQHEINLAVDPNFYDGGARQFWSDWRVGRAIMIDYNIGYHRIQSPQRMKGFHCSINTEGFGLVNLDLEQIYATSATVGTIEG